MKRRYYIDITGNDTFYTVVWVEASNIELALTHAFTIMNSYQKQTIEQLRITKVVEKKTSM